MKKWWEKKVGRRARLTFILGPLTPFQSIYTDLLFPYLLISPPSFWWPFYFMEARAEPLLVHLVREQESRNQDNLFFGYDKSLCSWRRRSSTWWGESKVNLNTLNHASIPQSVCFMYVFRFFSCLNWWLSRRTSWAPLTSRLLPLHPSTPSSQGK